MTALRNLSIALAITSALVLIASSTWAAQESSYREDRYNYAYLGACLASGRTIYTDCWDHKPPLVMWINQGVLTLFSNRTWPISLAAGLASTLTVISLTLASWIWYGGWVATFMLLVSSFTVSLRWFGGCDNVTETYATCFEALALFFIATGWRIRSRARVGWLLLAGASFGAAFLCKQHAAAGPLALTTVTFLFLALRIPNSAQLLKSQLAACFAFACVLGGATLWLQHLGVLHEALYAVFGFHKHFVTGGLSILIPWSEPALSVYRKTEPILVVIWLAVIGTVATLAEQRKLPRESRDTLRLASLIGMLVWLVFATAIVLLGPYHSYRYWQAAFVPLLWLASAGLAAIVTAIKQGSASMRAVIGVSSAAILWAWGLPAWTDQYHAILNAFYLATEDSDRARIESVAKSVAARTRPDETIFTSDYQPGIYLYSYRFPPGRFTNITKLQDAEVGKDFIAPELIRDFATRPPALILIPFRAYLYMQDTRSKEPQLVDLPRILSEHYRPDGDVGGYEIFVRSTPATAPSATSPAAAPN